MKSIFAFLSIIIFVVSCGQYEAQTLVLTDEEIQGYWITDEVATKTGFKDEATKCSVIVTKPGSNEKIYPKAYLIKGREIATVYTDPAKSAEPLDAFALVNLDGTISPLHNDQEGLVRLSPTVDIDKLLLKVKGQEGAVTLQRVSAARMVDIQKIIKDCQ